MNDPLQELLRLGAIPTTSFPPESRYHRIGTTTLVTRDGRTVTHLRRRFIPLPEALALAVEHPVGAGDRLDNLAAQYLGDPELFWRICDANGALRPDDLVEIGRRLRIALPEGMSATEGEDG